jgi:hypothetical protein
VTTAAWSRGATAWAAVAAGVASGISAAAQIGKVVIATPMLQAVIGLILLRPVR